MIFNLNELNFLSFKVQIFRLPKKKIFIVMIKDNKL